MFCRNCGAEMNANQAICVKCGVKTGDGDKFCPNCGKEVSPNASVCLNCGVAISGKNTSSGIQGDLGGKDKTMIVLLAVFFGMIGVHNFVLGETKKGVAKLLLSTVGACIFVGPVVSLVLVIMDIVKIAGNTYVIDKEKFF